MAAFDLEHDRYLVIAHYNGLEAFGHCNLDEDLTMKMLLHNWERNFPVGADRFDKITIVLECA